MNCKIRRWELCVSHYKVQAFQPCFAVPLNLTEYLTLAGL
jgi:hypothetical protein